MHGKKLKIGTGVARLIINPQTFYSLKEFELKTMAKIRDKDHTDSAKNQ